MRSLFLVIALSGCALGFRAGAGPTVDTDGSVGANVWVGGYFGFGEDDELAVTMVAEGSAGGASGNGATLGFSAGWDIALLDDEDAVFRIGPRLRAGWFFAGDSNRDVGVDLVVAGAPPRMRRHHLQIEMRLGLGLDAQDGFGPVQRGTFAAAIVYDRLRVTSLSELF